MKRGYRFLHCNIIYYALHRSIHGTKCFTNTYHCTDIYSLVFAAFNSFTSCEPCVQNNVVETISKQQCLNLETYFVQYQACSFGIMSCAGSFVHDSMLNRLVLHHRCIQIWWKCDGQRDCRDGSDEPPTCPPRYCRLGQFQCNDGNCTSSQQLCDNNRDCHDGSDEDPVLCGWLTDLNS